MIVITGGAGFIGLHLEAALRAKGHRVVSIDDLSATKVWRGAGMLVQADITKPEHHYMVEDVIRQSDMVFHLAASFANYRSVLEPLYDANANIMGSIRIAQLCARHNKPLVYAGSSSSYGQQGTPLRESSQMLPSTPYALSKWAGEQYCNQLHTATFSPYLFNVFGTGDYPDVYRNALPAMVESAVGRGRIVVHGEHSYRDFTPVVAVADLLSDITPDMVYRHAGERVNLCSGVPTYSHELAQLVMEAVPGSVVQIGPPRTWDKVNGRVGDPSKCRLMFGDKADSLSKDKTDRLRAAIEWVKGTIHGHA